MAFKINHKSASSLLLPLSWGFAILLPFFFYWQRSSYFGETLIDIGSDLYIAWRIVEGEHIYRDLSYFFGPIGPYFTALFFRIFGVSREVMVTTNFFVFLGTIICICLIIKKRFVRSAMPAALLFITLLFAFGQTRLISNYNFLTPYRTGVVWALFFALGSLASLGIAIEGRRIRRLYWFISGALAGLTALAKPEFYIALAAAIAWSILYISVWESKIRFRAILSLTAGMAMPPIISIFYFHMSAGLELSQSIYYFAQPYLLFLNSKFRSMNIYTNILTGNDVQLTGLAWSSQWTRLAPFFCFFAFLSCVHLVRTSSHAWQRRRTVFLGSCLLFSTFLALKVFLNATNDHYGFALAMPSALSLFLFLFAIAPRTKFFRKKYNQFRNTWQLCIILLLTPHAIWLQTLTHELMQMKDVKITSKNNRFNYYTYRMDSIWIQQVVEYLRSRLKPEETATFLPDGSFINFILERRSPLYFLDLLPGQFFIYGTNSIITQMSEKRSDVIVITPRDTEEFGMGTFQDGYGKPIYEWIKANYEKASDTPQLPWSLKTEIFFLKKTNK